MHYGFYPLTIFVKSSFIDVSLGPKYASQSQLFISVSLIHCLERKLFSRNLILTCCWNIRNDTSFLKSPTNCSKTNLRNTIHIYTVQKKKFPTKDFFRKSDQSSFFYYHLASINLSASMYFKIFGYLDHQGKWWLGMIYDAIILKRVRVVSERFCAGSLWCRSVGESFSWYNNTILLCNYFNFITIPNKKRRIPQEP